MGSDGARNPTKKQMPDAPSSPGFTGITDEMLRKSTFHANVAQQVITVTKDRLELCLIHHRERFESRQQWLLPFGLFLTFLLTLLTTDPKDSLGFKAATWQAIFFISAVIALIWTIIWGGRALSSWWRQPTPAVDAILGDLTTVAATIQTQSITAPARPVGDNQ